MRIVEITTRDLQRDGRAVVEFSDKEITILNNIFGKANHSGWLTSDTAQKMLRDVKTVSEIARHGQLDTVAISMLNALLTKKKEVKT